MKRFLCIILSIFLIAACFCACSKKADEAETTEQSLSDRVKFNFDSAYKSTDESAVSAYEAICKATIDYTTEVRMNTALYDSALQLFYTSFPLSELVNDIKINEDNTGVVISFKLSEEEHKKQTEAFINKCDEIINKCSEATTNKAVFAVKLYSYIASSVNKSEDETVSCYDTIMNGKGNSFSYSQEFEYLLRQKDIPSYHVIASDAVGSGWGIAGAELYGNVYYFDIMSEYFDNGGSKLKYFGMTTEDLKAEGLKNPVFTNREDAIDASDLKFDICRKCDSYTLEGAKLLVTTKNEDIVEVAL